MFNVPYSTNVQSFEYYCKSRMFCTISLRYAEQWKVGLAPCFPLCVAWFISSLAAAWCTLSTLWISDAPFWEDLLPFRGRVHFIMAVFVHLLDSDHIISLQFFSFLWGFCFFPVWKLVFPGKFSSRATSVFHEGDLGQRVQWLAF